MVIAATMLRALETDKDPLFYKTNVIKAQKLLSVE